MVKKMVEEPIRKENIMSRHGERIRKRADGRWEGRYKVGNYETGSTKYASVYGHSYAEVKAKLEEKIFETVQPEKVTTPLFKDVALDWLRMNHQKNKGSTEAKYEFLISKHLIPYLGEYQIGKLSTEILNSFCEKKLCGDKYNQPLAPSYVRSMMLVANSILNFAVAEKICLPLNTPIYKPSIEKREIRILKKAEQIVLEDFLRKDIDKTKLGVLITLYTGLRIGEVCALRWEDIDFSSEIITVKSTISRVSSDSKERKTKLVVDTPKTTSSIRKIPIPEAICEAIKAEREHSLSEFVISENKSFLSPRTYEYRFHRILEDCSITPVNYHALRHTFATRCVEVGVDIKTLSEILGHASVSITLNTYVHPSMDLKRLQINKLSPLI